VPGAVSLSHLAVAHILQATTKQSFFPDGEAIMLDGQNESSACV